MVLRRLFLLILMLCLFFFNSASWAQPEAGPLVISGQGFSLRALRQGALAWSNRTYVFERVPQELEDWDFTQLAGGEDAVVSVTGTSESLVTVASVKPEAEMPGWQLHKGWVISYSDSKHTAMQVYTRTLGAGESLTLPQADWWGTLVLAPSLAFGSASSLPLGTPVDRSPKAATVYFGSPSLAVLPNGDYLAAHDLFGPGTTFNRTVIFRSSDKGVTWHPLSEVLGAFWSSLFVHRGALYLMGASKEYGDVVIFRSDDGGKHWTTPKDEHSGVLRSDSSFATAPVPIIEHDGRLWRAFEEAGGRGGWPRRFRAFMLSVPVEANLLDAKNWTSSNIIEPNPNWGGGKFNGWLEGNAVVAPDGTMLDVLRVEQTGGGTGSEAAAVVTLSPDGKRASFDSRDFVNLPGGNVKFTIRFDPQSKRYWSLVDAQRNPTALRNRLVLVSAADLRNWRVEMEVLSHTDRSHAYQYVDWLFEGDDIIFLSRTAWDGAHSFHDANYLTFHRLIRFLDADRRMVH